jgi:urease accessory protein
MPTTIEATQLLLLLNWMSPAFPVGTFAYSHGLEWAIDDGQVKTAKDVEAWIVDVITQGSGWNDAALFSNTRAQDAAEVNELALALASSKERYLETTQLGAAFTIAANVFVPTALGEGEVAYPVAAAHVCRSIGIAREHALLAFLQGFSNALISVAVRLIPLGQTEGLAVMRNMLPVIAATADRAAGASLDDLGAITLMSDIAAMKHETQHSRIFRS